MVIKHRSQLQYRKYVKVVPLTDTGGSNEGSNIAMAPIKYYGDCPFLQPDQTL